MSYVHKVIGQDEKIILVTRLHWIYPLEGFIFFLLLTSIGILINNFLWANAGTSLPFFELDLSFISPKVIQLSYYLLVPFAFALTGFLMFWALFITYISTEIGLTSHRIILKKGLILIDVQQVELEDIRGESINHGWLGWVIGYGKVLFDCRFIDDIYLPAISDPYKLIKAVHTARMRHDDIKTFGTDELNAEITRIDEERLIAFKARDKLKLLGRKVRKDFNTQH